jgi:hypothetical protein
LDLSSHSPTESTLPLTACSVGRWLMAGAGVFWEKSTAGWLLVAGLMWEKNTTGWFDFALVITNSRFTLL